MPKRSQRLSLTETGALLLGHAEEGLVSPQQKSDAGYRLYDGGAVRRLHFIKQGQHCAGAAPRRDKLRSVFIQQLRLTISAVTRTGVDQFG